MSDPKIDRAHWPEENVIFAVTSLDLKVSPEPHPFHLAEKTAAAENWRLEIAANPALFDGKMVLQHRVDIRDGAISSQAHVVPFSTFLWWRKTRPPGSALHLFGLPVILSSDGAVIAIRMGRHTANPGRVYCAAGSIDPDDVVDGRCDINGNMAREVREETGLDLADAFASPGFHALHGEDMVTLFRTYRFQETAEGLIARIRAHIETEAQSEIDEALAIFSADPDLHPYPPFMPRILARIFEGAATH
ncbi:DNA mismatch repair protein MutT [Pararhizobium antarcticum]|uniref:DNA mismatch repair protein MutT n=1 Tax=Pararhizobium antarcticum TaxID=1798805 RepID=A0A657LVH9_9HYPH|nr:DNA mismatch repair protein MutT [Pararhizobium antarcticum]OJF91980.1 DNA mismatch repair protein MutT [Rhizobium sp. 58]OJF98363.1 DNA mismatch repair protein MutT [Pararhizobium antarcticum]